MSVEINMTQEEKKAEKLTDAHLSLALEALRYFFLLLYILGTFVAVLAAPVRLLRVPDGGIQPQAVVDAKGDVLMAWTEGTGWNRGGVVVWQVFDSSGQPTNVAGRVEGLPVWSLVSAVVLPEGFAVIY